MNFNNLLHKILVYYSSKFFLRIVIIVSFTVLICFLSLYNFKKNEIIENEIPFMDKIVHFLMYFAYGIILYINNKSAKIKLPDLIITIYCVVFGFLMEYFQYAFFIYRSGDMIDLLSNIAGVILSYIFVNKRKLLQI